MATWFYVVVGDVMSLLITEHRAPLQPTVCATSAAKAATRVMVPIEQFIPSLSSSTAVVVESIS